MKPLILNSEDLQEGIFFTSDLHFGHKNIIKFCDRPFNDLGEMSNTLIRNWNSTILPDSTVFILGDFCFGGKQQWEYILNQLNGRKWLIMGNHDHAQKIPEYMFYGIREQMLIGVEKYGEVQEIFLSHYPMLSWPNSNRGSWQLFGHCHLRPNIQHYVTDKLSVNQYDVGVDNNGFKPVNFNTLYTIFKIQNVINQEICY